MVVDAAKPGWLQDDRAAQPDAGALDMLTLWASPDWVMVLDQDGLVLETNRGSPSGQHWTACWEGGDPAAAQALADAAAGGTGRFQAGDAESRQWWDVAVAPLPPAEGGAARLVAVARDVTALRPGGGEPWAALLERTNDFIAMARPDGSVLFVNPVGRRMLGIGDAQDVTAARLEDFVDPADRDLFCTTALPAAAQGGFWQGEIAFRHVQTGAAVPVVHTLFPLRDAQGRVTRLGTVTRDRRERHAAGERRAALLELGDRLRMTENLAEMSSVAAEIMGHALGASSAGYGRMSEDDAFFEMEGDWTAPGVASIASRLEVGNYGSYYANLRRGETVAVDDARLDPRTQDSAAALEALSARAFVNLPIIEGGRLVALFFVLSASARAWTAEELAFIRNVAERTRLAIERRRAEQALQALAASLERQVEARTRERDQVWLASRDMLCVANMDGYLTNLNPAWNATLGWTPDELQRRPFIDFVHPDDVPATVAAAAALAAGEPQLNFINRYRCRDGGYRWLSWNAVPVAGLIYSTARDVTEERAQAAELQRSRATLRAVFETSFQSQVLLSLDGTVLEANAVSLATIMASRADVVGRPYWDTIWFTATPGMPERVRAGVMAAAAGDTTQMPIVVNRTAGRRSFDFSVRPLRGEAGQVVAVVAEAADTTDRLEAEEKLRQSQKMEAVGQLTGGLAHDFNNLLTGIGGSLELLQTRLAQGRMSDVDRYVTAAQGAARRAAALTHRLLAFSRRQTLAPKAVDANRLVMGMEDLIRRTVGPEVTVEVVTAGGLWNTLADPSQLENALLNLCINARDAMPHGGRLSIETANKWLDERAGQERDLPPGQYVSLGVSDNGTGMPPEVIARAFDPFFTTKPIGLGTGLGLSMIYGFARQSGGQVRIYSEVGQGTLVSLYLPRHLGDAETAEGAAALTHAPRALQGETVLVVDDEPTIRMLAAEVLEDLGYVAVEATDGASGLRVLRSGMRIDLLLTDVGLPGGMNGRQLADAARTLRPGLKVLFITGYAENAVLSHGHLEAGMHVLTKPFAMQTLASRIRALIA